MEKSRILGIKRRAHVNAVEPHLVRITLLVPEAALAGAGLGLELFAQKTGGLLVALFVRQAIERQHGPAGINIVEVVVLQSVAPDLPLRGDEGADDGASELPVARFIHPLTELNERKSEQADRIIPFGAATFLVDQAFAAPHDFGVGHADRPLQRTGAGKLARERCIGRPNGRAGQESDQKKRTVTDPGGSFHDEGPP